MALIQDHRFIPKSTQFLTCSRSSHKITSSLLQIKPNSFPNPPKKQLSAQKPQSCSKPINPTSLTLEGLTLNSQAFHENLQNCIGYCLSLPLISFTHPSIAAETTQASSDKINVEAIVTSIDDFFNRNPFFVSGVTFIWLVVIPLTQAYLRKYKAISAIDAFGKLRDVPEAQLLDIRKEKSVNFMASPNLKILNKNSVWIEFEEGKEENFLKKVFGTFGEPANTVLCILDNFDGESLKLAELLHKNGFKEAYAIKGGVRGKDGWLAIQEKCFPPSVHILPRKMKLAMSAQLQTNGDLTSVGASEGNDDNALDSSSSSSKDQLNNRFP